MTAISRALQSAYRTARGLSGVAVVYTRGLNSVSLTAIPGAQVHSVERDGEFHEEIKSRDYLILATELIIDGEETLPQRNDTITEGDQVYKVLWVGGESQWEWTDPQRVIIRVKTKAI